MNNLENEHIEYFKKALEETEKENYQEAEKIYIELIEKEIFEAYNNLGNLYRKQGLINRAIEAYKTAILKLSDYPLPYFNLGCTLMELERYSEALLFLEKAERLGLKGFDIDVQLSLCYLATNNYSKAKERLKNETVREEVKKYVVEVEKIDKL